VDETPTQTFRRIAPGWAWLRANFSLPAVLSIASVVLVAGVGYLEQRADLKAIRQADPTARLERLENDIKTLLEQRAADRQQLDDLASEVAAQRRQWDRVEQVAETAPPRIRRRRP
jgi:hypothetical protein